MLKVVENGEVEEINNVSSEYPYSLKCISGEYLMLRDSIGISLVKVDNLTLTFKLIKNISKYGGDLTE